MKSFLKLTAQNSGIALLMTLFVLIFLSVIAMNFSFSTRWGSAGARNFKEETIAYYSALSGFEEARKYLLSDKDTTVDFMDEGGVFYLDKETKPVTGKRTIGDSEIEIKLSDADSRININAANGVLLQKLLSFTGVAADLAQELSDCVQDWRDPDDLHHASGAESDYYESLSPPYKAKNANFSSVEELLLVKGFKREYLYGSEEIRPLLPLISTDGDDGINVNTAPREILELTGLSAEIVDLIMKQRTLEMGGAKQIPASPQSNMRYKTTSNNFIIEVTASMKGSKQTVRITSVVRRVPVAKGFDLKTVYWREKVESRRS